jgi:type I restriction enzyme M protein
LPQLAPAPPSKAEAPVVSPLLPLTTSNGGTGRALTQQELEGRLWAAADSLRGPVDPADFKAYIFPLLFFKWISDTWDMEHQEAVDVYGLEVRDEEEADYHRFTIPDGCHWSDLRSTTSNVGVKLGLILDRLQSANPAKLAGIFGDVAWGNKERLPEASLLSLVSAFNRLMLNPNVVPHDVLGAAYEYLLRQFADASGKKAGEFFTPRAVVRLLVSILGPQTGETIYDPACGSGGMLVEAIGDVRENGGDPRTLRLYGQEVNLTTAAIARMNLFLHEIEDFSILRGDTLRDPLFRTPTGDLQRFDVVIANPPFSLANWGADAWVGDVRAFAGVPPASTGDLAWVQHMVFSMRANTGRVGVVMPHGVLFRGGVEKQIRRKLVESDVLDAVIGLPPNLFYSTSIPACLLIFRNTKATERTATVLFVDGSKRFTKGRNQNSMSESDIGPIVEAYRTATDIDGDGVGVRLVPLEEITNYGWDLNIGRYLQGAAAETVDVPTALARLAEVQTALRTAEEDLAERLRAAGYA